MVCKLDEQSLNVESEWAAHPVYYHPFQKMTTTIERTVVYIAATTTVTPTAINSASNMSQIQIMHWPIRY